MKRLTAMLLLLALLCASVSGCGGGEKAYVPTGNALYVEGQDLEEYLSGEKEPQELTLGYYPDRSMNPLIGNNITNRVLFSLIYQGLFAVDRYNEPYPILCGSYQVSASYMTYTYYLDEKATFSDGSRVTIEDVLATYEAARNSNYYGGRFTHVNSISLSGDGGITFTLNTAYRDFSMLLDIPILKATELEAEHPLGTGPYAFSEGISGAYLSKVQNWWCHTEIAATAENITLVETLNQSQLRDEFEFGDVGLACADPMSDSYAEYRCDYELWEVDNGMFVYLACNVGFSDFFTNSDVLRKALTYAIDRQTIVEENYRGKAYPSTLAASPGSPYYSKSLAANYEYDAMKFIDLISGWSPPKDDEGKDQKLRLLVNSDDSTRLRTARDIAEALTEMGVPCGTLEYGNSTKTTYQQVLAAGNYDLYLGQTKLSPNMDLSCFFGWKDLSRGGLTNDALYKRSLDALADVGNYYNLLKDVAEDARIIPVLFGYNAVFAERGLFEDLSPSRDNAFFYTLDKTMESIRIATVYE